MSEIPQWNTAAASRGYDHPIDRMEVAEGLVPVLEAPQIVPVYTEEQGRRTLDQLALPCEYDEYVLRALAQVAQNCQTERDRWEFANLQAMGISPNVLSDEMSDYARFAGKPERVAAFVNWFGRLASILPARRPEETIITQEGQLQKEELMDDAEQLRLEELVGLVNRVKGYTVTLGTASQSGVYDLSRPLDRAIVGGFDALTTPRYGYQVKRYDPKSAPRRHRLELMRVDGQDWQTDNGDILLHMIRERGVADIVSKDPFEDKLRVIKRFDSLVALRGVDLIRHMLNLIAADDGRIIDTKNMHDLNRFMHLYEATIRRQASFSGDKAIATSPVSTTFLLGDAKK